jgi:hypothetical protein
MKLKLVIPETAKERCDAPDPLRTATIIQQEQPEQEWIKTGWKGALTDIDAKFEDS